MVFGVTDNLMKLQLPQDTTVVCQGGQCQGQLREALGERIGTGSEDSEQDE